MLERVQTEVGELGDLFARRPDAEDAAGVLRALLAGEEVVVEPAVTYGHGPESTWRSDFRRRRSGAPRSCVRVLGMQHVSRPQARSGEPGRDRLAGPGERPYTRGTGMTAHTFRSKGFAVRARVLIAGVAGAVLILGPVPSASAAPVDAKVTTVCDPELERPDVVDRDTDRKRDKRDRDEHSTRIVPDVYTPRTDADSDDDEDYYPLRGGLFGEGDSDDGWDDSRADHRTSDKGKDKKKRFDTNNMSVDSALALICG